MSSTFKVAVIGTGFAERVQLPGFQRHPRFEVVAIAARDAENTRRVAQRFGVQRWYTDWHQMLQEGGFDLMSITTPPHLHCEMSLAALDAGLHVLCEKPMAMNAGEARRMLDRAQETRLTAMIDHEFRYLAARQRFGELIRGGYIGGLRRLVVSFHQNWRADPTRPWDWWSDADRGGGLLGAIGSHYFDATQHWFRRPTRVWGKLNAFIPERPTPDGQASRPVTADDACVAILDLGDRMEAVFELTAIANAGSGSRVMALGSAGTLVIEDDRRLLGGRGGTALQPLSFTELTRTPDEDWLLAPFLRLLDDLAAGIDHGTSPSPNFEDGLAHQQFIDAVKISNATGTWVDYPPAELPTSLAPR